MNDQNDTASNTNPDLESKVFDKASRRLQNPHHSSDENRFEEIRAIKKREELASEERMRELMEIEEARQTILRRQLAKKQKRDRQLLTLSFGIILAFVFIVVVYTLIVYLTG